MTAIDGSGYTSGDNVVRWFSEDGGTLVNDGTIVFPDEAPTRTVYFCGQFDNAGTVELNDNVNFENECEGTSIDNTGTITKAAGTGTASISVPLENESTVSVSSGELDMNGGTPSSLSSAGTYRADSPATLDIGGPESWNGAQTVGTGTVEISGTLTAAGPVSLIGAVTLTGTLEGAGATTISGSLTWGPNGQFAGSGTTTIEPGTTVTAIDGSGYTSGDNVVRWFSEDGGTLVNDGTIVFPDEAPTRTVYFCGQFDNAGTVELNDNVNFENECEGTSIDNTGTITKAAGTGTASISVPLENESTVSVGASDGGHGTLDISNLSDLRLVQHDAVGWDVRGDPRGQSPARQRGDGHHYQRRGGRRRRRVLGSRIQFHAGALVGVRRWPPRWGDPPQRPEPHHPRTASQRRGGPSRPLL